MLHAAGVKITLFSQIGDAAIAAGFLISCAADFDSAVEIGMFFDEGLGRDDAGSQPAFHVAGPTSVDFPVDQITAEGIFGPACADFDHIRVAVEMYAVAG